MKPMKPLCTVWFWLSAVATGLLLAVIIALCTGCAFINHPFNWFP